MDVESALESIFKLAFEFAGEFAVEFAVGCGIESGKKLLENSFGFSTGSQFSSRTNTKKRECNG